MIQTFKCALSAGESTATKGDTTPQGIGNLDRTFIAQGSASSKPERIRLIG